MQYSGVEIQLTEKMFNLLFQLHWISEGILEEMYMSYLRMYSL